MKKNSSLKKIFRAIPAYVRIFFGEMIFRVRKRRLVGALTQYKYSDEHLKFVHIMEAINYLRVAGGRGRFLPQTYLEFGCHSGRTFSAAVNASNYFGMSNVEFYAFDSFEGLPATNEGEDGCFTTGSFYTSRAEFVEILKQRTGCNIPEKNIIDGFFNKSLTTEVQRRMPKAGIVHIDVDLYSSTVDVLRFIKPLLVQGSLLIFDDWYAFPGGSLMGERRALSEFLEQNPGFEVEPWKAYSTFGQSFFVSTVPLPDCNSEKSS